jgi:chromosome segregation ATPase
MDTNIVPVSEAEMANWTQRLTTMVVGYSRQAQELTEIKDSVNSLAEQVSILKTERDDAMKASMENEQRLNDARRHRDELESRVGTLNEAIIGRDSRVKELEGLLTSARLEAEDWQRKCERQERMSQDYQNQLATVRERRDHWHNRAEDAERALADTRNKLKAIEDQVGSILGMVAKPAEVVEVPQLNPQQSTGTSTLGANESQSDTSQSPKPWWQSESKASESF